MLAMKGDDSLTAGNLQFLSQNLGSMVPLSSFVFRRWTSNVDVGEVMADIFISVSTKSRIFMQIGFKFLFHPHALNRNVINGMTSSLSSTASKQSSRVGDSDSEENYENGSDLPEEAGNGVEPKDDGDTNKINGTLGKNGTEHSATVKDMNVGMNKMELLKQPVFGWDWFVRNKFSMFSMTAAGLAMSAASRVISRDLRVKL